MLWADASMLGDIAVKGCLVWGRDSMLATLEVRLDCLGRGSGVTV